jgi:hypothetical protein
MKKFTPYVYFLCILFHPAVLANQDQSISNAKEQVLGLLDMIEERNKLVNEKMFGTTSAEESNPPVMDTNKAGIPEPVSYINPSISAFINGIRDPFAVTQEIALLNQASQTTQGAYADHSFKSSSLAFTLPKLTMKGVIFKKTRKTSNCFTRNRWKWGLYGQGGR